MPHSTMSAAETIAHAPIKKSRVPGFLKKKRFYLLLLLVILGGVWYWQSQKNNAVIAYETFKAEQRTLVQSVEVTGEIKPAVRIDLAFESSGTLKNMYVEVGDEVERGDVLAELEDQNLNFAYRRAQAAIAMALANLNQRLAGESEESIRVAEAQLEQAKVAYEKAVSDYQDTEVQIQNDLESAQIALDTARNNLANAAPLSDQALKNAIETARVSMVAALGPIKSALVDGDSIIGVEDTATNQLYKKYLGIWSFGSLQTAEYSYRRAKDATDAVTDAVDDISTQSSKTDVLRAVDVLLSAINETQTFLLDVQHVLANSGSSPTFPQSSIEAMKVTINGDYANVSGQKSAVVVARQAVETAELSKTSDYNRLEDAVKAAEVVYNIALTNIDLRKNSAQANVGIQKAAMDAAQAALDLKKAGPREVDVAGLRAQVQDAQVALDQAASNLTKIKITAPVDGTITDVVSDIGEQIVANTSQIRMIGTAKYDIEAQVPEADITKVKVGQTAIITLDAYGDDIEFTGTVTAENPDQTVIQDAIYYDVRVHIDPRDMEIKPGMTANVTIETARVENAVVIPLRAIRTDSETNEKRVRVLVGEQPVERTVAPGLKGDEGRVQILEGVYKDDAVILREIES